MTLFKRGAEVGLRVVGRDDDRYARGLETSVQACIRSQADKRPASSRCLRRPLERLARPRTRRGPSPQGRRDVGRRPSLASYSTALWPLVRRTSTLTVEQRVAYEAGERLAEVVEQREAGRAQRGVVEHRVGRAGRRSRRAKFGGGDRPHPAGSSPAAASTARANSYQLTAPWLVTWKSPGRAITAERPDHRRQVGGERRDGRAGRRRTASSVVCAASRSIVFTMLAPWRRTPTTCARSSRCRARPRARPPASIGRRPTAARAVPLEVGRRLRAVEDVVGRHVARGGRRPTRPRLGDLAHGEGVGGKGPVGIGLAGVDRGPRRAVHDRVGSGCAHSVRARRRDR